MLQAAPYLWHGWGATVQNIHLLSVHDCDMELEACSAIERTKCLAIIEILELRLSIGIVGLD